MPPPAPMVASGRASAAGGKPSPKNQGQSAERRDKVAPYQSAEGSVSSQNDCPDPRSDCKRKRQRKKQQSRADWGQPSETLKREAQDKDETVHRDVAVKPPRVLTKLEGTALRPNFIARRAHSNLLVLVRNKHPPAAAHDGKGLGEVIDERSDCRAACPWPS